MPPANSPQDTPPRTQSSVPRTLSPDRETAVPLDLRLDQQQGDSEDVRFVTSPVSTGTGTGAYTSTSPSPPPRAAREAARRQRLLRDLNRMDRASPDTHDASDTPTANTHARTESVSDDTEQRQRLQRVLARLSRRHESATSYGHRIPQPAQQSLYDWAPSQPSEQDDDQGLDEILETLRSQHPSTHSDILEFLGRRQLYRQRESDYDAALRLRREQPRTDAATDRRISDTLRSAAIMQNARSRVRSPNGTDRITRYLRNREQWQRAEGESDDALLAAVTYPNSLSSTEASRRRAAGSTHQPRQGPLSSRRQDAIVEPAGRRVDDLRARIDAHWRNYLADSPTSQRTPASSSSQIPSLENAVKYLDALRSCSSYDESLSAAIDHGFALKDFFADNHNDFVTNVAHCPQPASSSLLQPGAVFEGTQNTAPPKDLEAAGWLSTNFSQSMQSRDSSRPFDATRPWLSHTAVPPAVVPTIRLDHSSPQRPYQDQWPVKVKIQAVDYEKMTVAGVMEAYDVPAYPASTAAGATSRSPHATIPNQPGPTRDPNASSAPPKRAFPITTFLEGQIIDFGVHSLLTPNTAHDTSQSPASHGNARPTSSPPGIKFPPTSAITDAANWRNLPPFNAMQSDEEVARALLSRSRMAQITSDWIFMRWKERCFIHSKSDTCHRPENDNTARSGGGAAVMPLSGEGDDQDTGHGLTISGFYYVSLRRSDGGIEGLYFDAKTSPYQQLRLRSKGSGLHGAWGFK